MLITEAYRAQQAHLHETTNYGTASIDYAPLVTQIIDKLGLDHILDYGCGKQMNLLRHIKPKQKLKYQGYEPAIPEMAEPPIPAQGVFCIDVLEHVEPDLIDNVLDDLMRLTEAVAFLTIHTGPAKKTLPDGRNAHLIQQPVEWWLPKLMERWELQTVQRTGDHAFYFIGYVKRRIESVDGGKAA